MPIDERQPLSFEDVRLIFRNFSGKEKQFNKEGDRNFCFLLDDEQAERLQNNGYPVRVLSPREEDDEPQPYLKVTVKYTEKSRPPKVVVLNKFGKTEIDERTIGTLDWAEIISVDLTIRPYDWEVNKRTGRSAYLKTMYITINVDEFEAKYRNIPSSEDDEDPPF